MRAAVSHYRILEKIGEGGMGEVWKAQDTRLDRLVALKFLPPGRMAEPERKRRFIQEARTASALNHPNIVTIYDIGSEDGLDFIAMEYVAGKTLDRFLAPGGVPYRQAINWAIRIAAALAAAHSKGIVHRDVKPGNVIASEQGLVKVLDFGLSKLMETSDAGQHSATATMLNAPRTEEGTLLGTVAYMSPEQVESRPVDGRSDIFSFGVLLYELVTGRRPFGGDSKISVLAGILREEPVAISSISPDVPHDLDRIVTRCLRKDPSRRYQNMDDVRIALEDLKEESESGMRTQPAIAAPPHSIWPRAWLWPAAVAALGLIAVGIWQYSRRHESPGIGPSLTRLTHDSGLTTDAALSPDGRLMAYASDRAGEGSLDIWVRQLGGGDPTRITNRPEDEYEPNFAPDGARIAYRSDAGVGGIYTVSALGGQPRLLVPEGRGPRYSPDGKQIAFWKGNPKAGTPTSQGAATIWVAPADGGQARQIAVDFAVAARPEWTPDGKHLVFSGAPKEGSIQDIWVAPVDGGACLNTGFRALIKGKLRFLGRYPLLVRDFAGRFYISLSNGDAENLWSVKLSPPAWKAGELHRVTNGTESESQPAVAGNRLAFTAETHSQQVWSVRLDANSGQVQGPPEQVTHGDDSAMPRLSADGKKLLYQSSRPGDRRAIVRDLVSGAETVVASDVSLHHPVFSPDGERIAYRIHTGTGSQSDLLVVSAAGGVAQKLCSDCGTTLNWTNDGRQVMFKKGNGIGLLSVPGGEQTMLFNNPKYPLWQPQLTPDSRWMAFVEVPTEGHAGIRVAPYHPGVKPEEWIAVTTADAENDKPRWSPSGQLLYYTSNRDGFRCIWARKLNPATRRPVGDPFAVIHFHSTAKSLSNVTLNDLETTLAPGRLLFVLGERRGNIWTLAQQ